MAQGFVSLNRTPPNPIPETVAQSKGKASVRVSLFMVERRGRPKAQYRGMNNW